LPSAVLLSLVLVSPAPFAEATSAGPRHLELRLVDTNGMASYWSIALASSGTVTRVGEVPRGPQHLSPADLDHIRVLLQSQRFFSLLSGYGACPVDGRMRMLTAILDSERNDVVLCDLPSEGAGSQARALLRVWYGALAIVAPDVQVEPKDALVLEEEK
jgi:hypothetical protein